LSCASAPSEEDTEGTVEQQAPADSSEGGQASNDNSTPADEFSEFSDEPAAKSNEPPATENQNTAQGESEPNFEEAPAEPTPSTPEPPPAVTETQPEPAQPAPVHAAHPVEITNLKFKGNDNGGTIIVEANGPLTYTTRMNPDLKQFIVEIPNSVLPSKLKRNLNTKDIEGAIGSIDAYQNPGSNMSRFVIQLREGASEPAVQAEGQSLLIVASGSPVPTKSASSVSSASGGKEINNGLNRELGDEKILTSQSLQEFLSGNQKFYGAPISIEVDNIDIKEALRFIASESGLNMVIAEDVTGKVSLKLQNVPWDQALVVLMKAKKLGYARQGSVIRIATLTDLKQEEDDATKLAQAKKTVEQLKVKVIPVSYAKVDDLAKNLKDFLSERGKIVADTRTASIIVTDIEEGLDRITKLLSSLDVQPPQVMIEGKIVEASENFQKQLGVSWGFSGQDVSIMNGRSGPVNLTPSLTVAPGGSNAGGTNFGFGLRLGVLDILGDLDANLRLSETENLVKIISSPRIVTLTNEEAKINSTNQVPIKTTTVVPGGTATTNVTFKPLELELNVTPQVTAEGSVLMKVNVKREIQAPASAGSTDFGINSRSAMTKVLIKNGQTAVLGGIYQTDASDGEERVPGLSSIPVLGSLFRSTIQRKEKLELLIFLTPRILDPGQMVQTASGGSSTN
jgi:type IV pilus assembly protein PilQ